MSPNSKKRTKAAAWLTFVITLLYSLYATSDGESLTIPPGISRIGL
jgi:hypothetical protein